MRFAFLCSILTANYVVASVCKPRQSSDSGISTVDVGTKTTTASIDLSTSIAAITTDAGSTTEAVTTDVTSLYTETETTSTTATTSDIPLGTFSLLAPDLDTDNKKLASSGQNDGVRVFWEGVRSPGWVLSVSIEPTTNYVREANGLYLCVKYGDTTSPNDVKLCALASLNNPSFGALTCEITTGQKIACSAPAGQCIGDDAENKICSQLTGTFDQFYYYKAPGSGQGINLAMASAENPPDDSQTAVELEVAK